MEKMLKSKQKRIEFFQSMNIPNLDPLYSFENQEIINSFRLITKKDNKKNLKINDQIIIPPIIPNNFKLKLLTENKNKTRNLEGLHKKNKSEYTILNDSNSNILQVRSSSNINNFDNNFNKIPSSKFNYILQLTEESKISKTTNIPRSEESLNPLDLKRSLGSRDLFNKVFSKYMKNNSPSIENEKIVNCLAMDDFQRIFANVVGGNNKVLPSSTQNKNSNYIDILSKKNGKMIKKTSNKKVLMPSPKYSDSKNRLQIENYKF